MPEKQRRHGNGKETSENGEARTLVLGCSKEGNLQDAKAVKSQGLLIDMSGKNPEEQKRDDTLMDTVDRINRSFGKDTLVFGSQGTKQQWRGASDHCSPNYTLDIAGFPVVKAK
ncbi:MAG: DUF4113 domain-containing protein [Planctomycetaceae bacterium]|nr:DUF4113 domain-containing protein [Planctomycetaceae bacterium]